MERGLVAGRGLGRGAARSEDAGASALRRLVSFAGQRYPKGSIVGSRAVLDHWLTNVLGGGTFSQRSPFAHWFEDVRALGFLRPPWGLAFDTLFRTSQD